MTSEERQKQLLLWLRDIFEDAIHEASAIGAALPGGGEEFDNEMFNLRRRVNWRVRRALGFRRERGR